MYYCRQAGRQTSFSLADTSVNPCVLPLRVLVLLEQTLSMLLCFFFSLYFFLARALDVQQVRETLARTRARFARCCYDAVLFFLLSPCGHPPTCCPGFFIYIRIVFRFVPAVLIGHFFLLLSFRFEPSAAILSVGR